MTLRRRDMTTSKTSTSTSRTKKKMIAETARKVK
jgi:hypothetical protein